MTDEPDPIAPAVTLVPVSEVVEAGSVLILEGTQDRASRGSRGADRTVIGIVGGAPGTRYDRLAPLAPPGAIVTCLADAQFGPIAPGDLLAASPTVGHAMRSPDAAPGTIVAKALDALQSGTGAIRVLVLFR